MKADKAISSILLRIEKLERAVFDQKKVAAPSQTPLISASLGHSSLR